MAIAIAIDRQAIQAFCRRNGIAQLSVFGSVTRDDFSSESDIDVLLEFGPGHTPGFVGLHQLEGSLSDLLGGRRVDLVTRRALNHRLRDAILAEAEVLYAEG